MQHNIINPFYSARMRYIAPTRTAPPPNSEPTTPVFARLPLAPKNASPVPHLTSLYHFHRAGDYGDRSYPGNCGGNLIKDLLSYFKPGLVLDPMSGSGTCADVCRDLNIPCFSFDIHQGFDACDSREFPGAETFDFIWSHPAYWRQKLYADDPRDLSRSPTLDHFLRRYGQFVRNSARALKPGGKLAILMGDYCDREAGFVPLTFHTKRLAFEYGLTQCCTDIIRFSHGASSSRKVYRSSFIPGLHDTCMVFERPLPSRKGGHV
jgi:SAM-dependent methyltransferase